MSYLEKLKQYKHSGGMEGAVNPPLSPGKKVKSIPGYELTSPTSFLGSTTVGPVADVLPTPVPGHENGQAPAASSPVKYARRRSLASTPPPPTGPLTNGQQGPLSFLYSVLRDGIVARGIFISQGIRTEPEALSCLRRRYPELRVQWARLIQHPVCSGCRYYTGGVLCNADRSPDYAAVVGSCGKYEVAVRGEP
jgi:hypothetical protein